MNDDAQIVLSHTKSYLNLMNNIRLRDINIKLS